MVRHNVDHLFAIGLAAARGNGHAQNGFLTVVVQAGHELELAAALRLVDGPAGEAARHLRDVFLGVAAVHPQGVQLQQLAAVILVQATALRARSAAESLRGSGTDRLPVIQVEQHGRAFGGGFQQVAELAQHVRADGVALVFGGQVTVGSLVHEDVEMVEPEIGQHFVQLAIAIDGAQNLTLLEVAHHNLRRSGGELDAAAQLRRRGHEQRLPHLLGQRADHVRLLLRRQPHERRQALPRRAGAERADLRRRQQLRQGLRGGCVGRRLHSVALLRFGALHQLPDHHEPVRIGGKGNLPGGHLLHDLRRRIIADQLIAGHGEAVERFQLFHQHGILGNALGVQLLVDPLFQPHGLHQRGIAGARAESEPVQSLQNAIVFGNLFGKAGGSGAGLLGVNRHSRIRRQRQQYSQPPECFTAHFFPSGLLNSILCGELRWGGIVFPARSGKPGGGLPGRSGPATISAAASAIFSAESILFPAEPSPFSVPR